MSIRAARPGPRSGPPWPGHLRAVPGPALLLSGPCRVSPRAAPTAQARARGLVSCRASPRSPACLSGSGHPRPTKGGGAWQGGGVPVARGRRGGGPARRGSPVAGGGAGRRLAGRGRRRRSPAAGRGRRAGGEKRKCGGARSRVAVRGKGAASRRRRRLAGRRRRGGGWRGGDDEAAAGKRSRGAATDGADRRRGGGAVAGGVAVLAGVSPSRGDAIAVSGLGGGREREAGALREKCWNKIDT